MPEHTAYSVYVVWRPVLSTNPHGKMHVACFYICVCACLWYRTSFFITTISHRPFHIMFTVSICEYYGNVKNKQSHTNEVYVQLVMLPFLLVLSSFVLLFCLFSWAILFAFSMTSIVNYAFYGWKTHSQSSILLWAQINRVLKCFMFNL